MISCTFCRKALPRIKVTKLRTGEEFKEETIVCDCSEAQKLHKDLLIRLKT